MALVPATLKHVAHILRLGGKKPELKRGRYTPANCPGRYVTQLSDDQLPGRVQGSGLDPASEAIIRRVEIPDWVISVLAVLVVAGVNSLFGAFGVLALGVVATGVWIAQIITRTRSVRGRDSGPPA